MRPPPVSRPVRLSRAALALAGLSLAVLFLAVLPLGAAQAQERMQPGLWQTEVVTQTGSRPSAPLTQQQCITPQIAGGSNGSAGEIRAAMLKEAPDCQIEEVTAEAERVTFRQTCGPLRQEGQFVYRQTRMEGRVTMTLAGKEPVTIVTQGRRLGPCPNPS